MTLPVSAPEDDHERWLLAHRHGTGVEEALAFLDRLPPVPVASLVGRWHGSGWHTGHPWDGLLEGHRWYGKEFAGADDVRPMLLRDAVGDPQPVSPRLAPVGLISAHPAAAGHPLVRAGVRLVRPLLGSARPAGRLRLVEYRGVVSAALVYDDVPIIDVLRRVGDDLVLGAADIRGQASPLFFLLRRSPAPPGNADRPGSRRPSGRTASRSLPGPRASW